MYELNGRPIAEIKITGGKINAPVSAERLTIPVKFKAGAPKPAPRPVPYQWGIRRQFIGTYLDSDVPSYDTPATSGFRLPGAASRGPPRGARAPHQLRL